MEIRKLLGLRALIALVLISLLMYAMFINFYFTYYPNGSPDKEIDQLMRQMRQSYGLILDDEAMADFKLKFEKEKEKFPDLMAENSAFAEAGITSYDVFKGISPDDNPVIDELHSYVFFETESRLAWDLQAYNMIISQYEDRDYWARMSKDNGWLQKHERYAALEESGSMRALIPRSAVMNYQSLYGYISVLVLVGTMFLLLPLYVRDRRLRILGLQYVSRIGRKIYGVKAMAGMVVGGIAAIVQLVIFFMLYRGNDTSIYFDVPFSSAFSTYFLWLDLTFGQYIIASIAILILLNAAIGAVVMMVSAMSSNYVTVLGVLVVIGFILFVLQHDFLFVRQFDMKYAQGSQLISYVAILLVAVISWLLLWRKERRRNVFDGA